MNDNMLIAKFMEVDFDLPYMWAPGHMCDFTEDLLNYDESWDWLMPVVEKIWKMVQNRQSLFYFNPQNMFDPERHSTASKWRYQKTIYGGIMDMHRGSFPSDDNMKDCYGAVVNFIKWWNSINE